jgi:hypothetical protein
MMLLVLGSALDDEPSLLATRWRQASRDVAVVTPVDLSRPGWRLRSGRPAESAAALTEGVLAGPDIEGIVAALAIVSPYELAHIADGDRDYVAQEMSAFLLAWLTELECPVIDRPTALSLAGCGRSPYEWAAIAHREGIGADPQWSGGTIGVTVVDGRATGHGRDSPLAAAAASIAAAARRLLVTLRFAEGAASPTVVGADPRPEVGDAATADALLAWFDRQ